MIPDHVIDVKQAVEYLEQFAWVQGFDSVIEKILEIDRKEDENESV